MFDESEFSEEALDSFHKRGVIAYREGKHMGENPYPIFTAPNMYWDKGWWETFYKETTIFVENLSAISESEKIEGFITEQSKFGSNNVYNLSFERNKRSKNHG